MQEARGPMNSVLATSAGFFSRLANVQLLAAARDVRDLGESPKRVAKAELDRHAESPDAVAGSEFIDDRLRLRE